MKGFFIKLQFWNGWNDSCFSDHLSYNGRLRIWVVAEYVRITFIIPRIIMLATKSLFRTEIAVAYRLCWTNPAYAGSSWQKYLILYIFEDYSSKKSNVRKKSSFTFVEQVIMLVPEFEMVVHKQEQQVTLRGQSRSTLKTTSAELPFLSFILASFPRRLIPRRSLPSRFHHHHDLPSCSSISAC